MLGKMTLYIKTTIFLSTIIGLVFGVLMLIPIVQLLIMFAFLLVGGIVVWLLRQSNMVEKFSPREAIVIGGISGFISVIAAGVSFLPLILCFGLFFKGGSGLIGSFFNSISSFVALVFLLLCVAFMSAIFNIGTALLLISGLNSLTENTENKVEK